MSHRQLDFCIFELAHQRVGVLESFCVHVQCGRPCGMRGCVRSQTQIPAQTESQMPLITLFHVSIADTWNNHHIDVDMCSVAG